jgi:hypothetical protein
MPTGATDSNSNSPDNPQLSALDRQIQAHQKADNERSWIGYVASQVWRGDRTTLADLEKLAQETRQAEQRGDTAKVSSMSREVQDKVQADKRALGIQDDISNYTSGALKMAGLFVGAGRFTAATKLGMIGMEGAGLSGWLGLAGSVGIHAADKAKVGDSGSELASNLALGALQGGVTKSLINSI